jgi:hypothetical protein
MKLEHLPPFHGFTGIGITLGAQFGCPGAEQSLE